MRGLVKEFNLNKNDLEELMDTKILSPEGQAIEVRELLTKGPIVFNFVVGTWSPLCLNHIKGLTEAMKQKDHTMVIISSESTSKIDSEFGKSVQWLSKNNLDLKYFSDTSRKMIALFKLKVPAFGFSKPATFLINQNSIVEISAGVPNNSKAVCSMSYYAKGVAA